MTKSDQMELELLRIRVKNLEKQNKELRQAQPGKLGSWVSIYLENRWAEISVPDREAVV